MADTEVLFPKLNHFWLDSGLLGLYELVRETHDDVTSTLSDDGLTIKGDYDAVEAALNRAYDRLIDEYYDLSTERQEVNRASYNFYYDSATDRFKDFPRKNAVVIVRLIHDQPLRPQRDKVKWKKEKRDVEVDGKLVKRTYGTLPPEYAHLQERLDAFLDDHDLNATGSGLLIDGPNEVRPKVRIALKEGRRRGTCYLCGDESHTRVDVNQTIFPFITGGSGGRSFNTLAGRPEKVCWKCAFVAKFVPVNGFYMTRVDQLFAFFPYSTSLTKMDDVFGLLEDFKHTDDPNRAKNFRHFLPVGKSEDGFFQRPFELMFAFLYTLYRKLLVHEEQDDGQESGARLVFDWDRMFELTLAKAPVEFVVVYAVTKGDTYLGKLAWPFRQSVYFFRLMDALETAGVDVKEVMRLLIDFSTTKYEYLTLLRNRVCERVLKQKSVVSLVESHSFHTDPQYMKPLVDFVVHYEDIIRKEGGMTPEEQEAAVKLGKRIGAIVGQAAKDRKGSRGNKGDLFALRKVRKKVDFLNQLNRLQFKYDLSVPPDVYDGKLTDKNYAEFKSFCMIAALNSFNAAARSGKEHKGG